MPLVVEYIGQDEDVDGEPVTETEPERRLDRWRYRFPWVKTAVDAPIDGDRLLIDNQTDRAWKLWHRFREIGMVAEGTQKRVRVVKAGLLTAQQLPARGTD